MRRSSSRLTLQSNRERLCRLGRPSAPRSPLPLLTGHSQAAENPHLWVPSLTWGPRIYSSPFPSQSATPPLLNLRKKKVGNEENLAGTDLKNQSTFLPIILVEPWRRYLWSSGWRPGSPAPALTPSRHHSGLSSVSTARWEKQERQHLCDNVNPDFPYGEDCNRR